MKKHLSSISMSLIGFFIASIVLMVTFSYLGYLELLSSKTITIINICSSFLSCFILAMFCGYKIHKKGLIIGILLSLLYFVIAAIMIAIKHTPITYLIIVSISVRIILLISGSIVGVNMASK